MSITTCRAVKINQVEIQSTMRTTPMRTAILHLKILNSLGLLDGGLDRKDIGSIFTGMSVNVTP
jgi:hypothetical protein